jgi:carboxypeptidase D
VIETYPQLIGYSTGMYDYVREQAHLCKLDLNLTYPQTGGKFNSIHIKYGQIRHRLGSGQQLSVNQPLPLGADIARRKRALDEDPEWQEEHVDLPPFNTTRTGKINKFFGCDIRDLVLTYAFNYSMVRVTFALVFPIA